MLQQVQTRALLASLTAAGLKADGFRRTPRWPRGGRFRCRCARRAAKRTPRLLKAKVEASFGAARRPSCWGPGDARSIQRRSRIAAMRVVQHRRRLFDPAIRRRRHVRRAWRASWRVEPTVPSICDRCRGCLPPGCSSSWTAFFWLAHLGAGTGEVQSRSVSLRCGHCATSVRTGSRQSCPVTEAERATDGSGHAMAAAFFQATGTR